MAKGFRYGGAVTSSSEKSLVLPSNPTITLYPDDGRIEVTWTKPVKTTPIVKYNVYYSTTAPNSVKDMTLAGETTSTTYIITGLTNDITWYVAVASVDADGYENASIWEVKNGIPTALKWVVGNNYGNIYYSTDGLNWTVAVTSNSADYEHTKFAYGNDVFVCLSSNYSNRSRMQWSSNGVNWSSCTLKFTLSNALTDIAYSATLKRFVAIGPYFIAWSDDGKTWYQGTGYSTSYAYRNVVAGDTAFLALGYNSTIYKSTDGKSWTSTSSSGSAYFHDEGVYGNGVWLRTYHTGSTMYIYSSSNDGSSWVLGNNSTFNSSSLPKFYYGNGAFWALDESNQKVYKSTSNGSTWSVINISATTTALGFYSGGGVLVGTNSGTVRRYDNNFTGFSSATLPDGKKITAFCSNKP